MPRGERDTRSPAEGRSRSSLRRVRGREGPPWASLIPVMKQVSCPPGNKVRVVGTEMKLSLCAARMEDAAPHRARPDRP